MSCDQNAEYAIEVHGLGKCYHIYDKPSDRLKQMLWRGRRQYYKEFWALKDVNFNIKKGETVGIIGRNGSGKSTLLQMICGTVNPTEGEVKVNGRVAALLELGAGFNPEFSGIENVYMAASLYGLRKDQIDQRFDEIAAFADIGDHINQPVKTYSSGMYVRLAFAVIAHVDADILVVDEALAVGDAIFTQKCMRFLRHFQASGGTLIFVSHDSAAVVSLCSKAILLSRGKLIDQGIPKEVSENYLNLIYQSTQAIDGVLLESKSISQPIDLIEEDYHDIRDQLINHSNLRNDIEVFKFSSSGMGFGTGGAKIVSVKILDETRKPLNWFVGGENIILEILSIAIDKIQNPIVGFELKDRLGQIIFCDNTYIQFMSENKSIQAGKKISTRFHFRLPRLPKGEYVISAAIADGTQDEHIQLHWLHDALAIKIHASSVVMGLIGLSIKKMTMEVQ